MLREFIKTVCRIAKAAGAEQNLCRKHLAVFFGSAGRHFLPQAVSAKFNNIFDLLSAWNGHTAPANLIGFLRFGASAERILSDFLKSTRCLTEHKNFIYKKLLITETEANEVRRRSIYQRFRRNY